MRTIISGYVAFHMYLLWREDMSEAEVTTMEAVWSSVKLPSADHVPPPVLHDGGVIATGIDTFGEPSGVAVAFDTKPRALYVYLTTSYMRGDAKVKVAWLKVDEGGKPLSRVFEGEPTEASSVVLSGVGLPSGLDVGYYVAAVYLDSAFLTAVPFIVVNDTKKEFPNFTGYMEWAQFALALQDFETAVAAADKAAASLGGTSVSNIDLIRATANVGLCAPERALPDLDKTLKVFPLNEFLALRGLVHWQMGDTQAGLADMERAADYIKGNAVFLSSRALILVSARKYPEALADINAAIALSTGVDAQLVSVRGYMHLTSGKHKEAEQDYRAVLNRIPDALTQLGLTIAMAKQTNAAASAQPLRSALDIAEEAIGTPGKACANPASAALFSMARETLAKLPSP